MGTKHTVVGWTSFMVMMVCLSSGSICLFLMFSAEQEAKTHSALFDMSDVMGDGLVALAGRVGAVIFFVISFFALFVWLISITVPKGQSPGK